MRSILALVLIAFSALSQAQNYDIVIANGRVIDTETQFDGIHYVGMNKGTIVEISPKKLSGKQVVDAKGLVVAPGFIDVHSHSPTLIDVAPCSAKS